MKQTAVEWLIEEINQQQKSYIDLAKKDKSLKKGVDAILTVTTLLKMKCEKAKEIEKQQKGYSEEDLKQFAFECVGNFLSNRENELEIELVNVISDRNNKLFEQFKNK